MKIGFYPGCSLNGGSQEYKKSVYSLAKLFDIELVYVPDWNCCGATAAHSMNKELSLSLPARILAIAEREGLTDVLVPCAACYTRLTVTQHELNHDEDLKKRIEGIIEMPMKGNVRILNIIQWIEQYILDKVPYKMFKPFNHKVACYYGCLLVRPHDILKFDRVENPESMDKLMRAIGADAIDWAFKTECCGAGLSISRTDIVGKLSGKIMKDAVDRGAEAIIVACPMCHSNLDMRRPAINKYLGVDIDIPILYISQAIGMAVGIDDKSLGFQHHMVDVKLTDKPYVATENIKEKTETEV